MSSIIFYLSRLRQSRLSAIHRGLLTSKPQSPLSPPIPPAPGLQMYVYAEVFKWVLII